MNGFKGRHFGGEIVLWAVRWYCRYAVSYRDLESMVTERGVAVDHSTIFRWVQRFAPEMEKRLRWQWRGPRSLSWRVDETCCRPEARSSPCLGVVASRAAWRRQWGRAALRSPATAPRVCAPAPPPSGHCGTQSAARPDRHRSGLPPSRSRLKAIRTGVWHNWILINLDAQAPPIEELVAPLADYYRDVAFPTSATSPPSPATPSPPTGRRSCERCARARLGSSPSRAASSARQGSSSMLAASDPAL